MTWPVDGPLHTDDGIQAQQLDGHRWIREIDLAGPQRSDQVRGSASTSTLRPTSNAVAGSTVGMHLVHPQHIGPQLLVAEGVETEYRLSVLVTRG